MRLSVKFHDIEGAYAYVVLLLDKLPQTNLIASAQVIVLADLHDVSGNMTSKKTQNAYIWACNTSILRILCTSHFIFWKLYAKVASLGFFSFQKEHRKRWY